MPPQQVLAEVASLPQEDLMKIQCGISDLIVSRFSQEEIAEINQALAESEAQFARGEFVSSTELRKQ